MWTTPIRLHGLSQRTRLTIDTKDIAGSPESPSMSDIITVRASSMDHVGELDRRDIPGYEGLYAVTRDGRVWAHPRQWATGVNGNIMLSHGGRWLKMFVAENGYVRVNLKSGARARSALVHRLVALAWIENPDDFPQINHISGVKCDNHADNLEWCTASHNRRHALRNGFPKTDAFLASVRKNVRAAQLVSRKLTQEQANELRRRYASGEQKTHLAKQFDIAFATLHVLLKGETYAR